MPRRKPALLIGPARGRRLAARLGVVAVSVVVACGEPPPSPMSVEDVRRVTAGIGRARIHGHTTRGTTWAQLDGAFQATPPRAAVVLPVFVSGTAHRVEARRIDDALYTERVVVDPSVLQPGVVDPIAALWLRRVDEPRWLSRRARVLRIVPDPALLGPFALLDLLVKAGATLEPRETDAIADAPVRRFEVGPTSRLVSHGFTRLDLWIDVTHRLRRVRVGTGNAVVDYEVTPLDAPVAVEAPPSAETTATLGRTPGAHRAPLGDLTVVASGQHESIAWRLLRAPAMGDGMCWRFDSTPALAPSGNDRAPCFGSPPPGAPPEFGVEFPFVANLGGPVDAIVAVARGGVRRASIGLADGTQESPRHVDRDAGIVVWLGHARPMAVSLTLVLSNGKTIGCGPGTVTSTADVVDAAGDELAELRTYPWACLERDP